MTYDEFCAEMIERFPQCQIVEDSSGEIVIYTDKAVNEVNGIVDFDPDPESESVTCHCSDCNLHYKSERECNCPHGIEGDHADTCWYADKQTITKPDKVIAVPTPVNDEVYARLHRLEHTLDTLLSSDLYSLNINVDGAMRIFYGSK